MKDLMDFCEKHKYIFCFGTGKYAGFVKKFLEKRDIKIHGFVVSPSNIDKNPQMFLGLSVSSIADVLNVGNNVGVILSIHPTYYKEIIDEVSTDYFYMDIELLNKIQYAEEFPQANIDKNVIISRAKLGKYTKIYNGAKIINSKVGDYSYIGSDDYIVNANIGKFCSFAPGIRCGIGRHPSKKFVSSHPAFFSVRGQIDVHFADRSYFEELLPICIGNDVWLGMNVIVLDGVRIGDGAIIGAGAVITKDVPPYAIVGGVPGHIIRYRFSSEQIRFLLQYPWWEKSENWLRKHFKIMHDIDLYMKHADHLND